MAQWRLAGRGVADRAALRALSERSAETFGAPPLRPSKGIIAAGHQAQLWHPGILAKDMAARFAAARLDAEPLHVVVDHDVLDEVAVDLPVHRGRKLSVRRLVLIKARSLVAACSQPPAPHGEVVQRIESAIADLGDALAADVGPLIDAFGDLPPCRHLAEQVTAALVRLKRPHVAPAAVVFASDLSSLDEFVDLCERMLHDARCCVRCYNQAAAARPEAAVATLRIEPDRVELPLWALTANEPRHRVFADLSDSKPTLALEHGGPINSAGTILAPRALLFTALMRCAYCDLFVHGKGGALYDRVTEQWFGDWLGAELAPMTVVSADLHMRFDAPVAAPVDLVRARWRVHHLPHNLDRFLKLDDPDSARKRILLTRMDDDRDRVRRSKAFREIHVINDALGRRHGEVLAGAQQQLEAAVAGVINRDIARKRDWCFAIYPPQQLAALASALESAS